jgi:hypothetical protein
LAERNSLRLYRICKGGFRSKSQNRWIREHAKIMRLSAFFWGWQLHWSGFMGPGTSHKDGRSGSYMEYRTFPKGDASHSLLLNQCPWSMNLSTTRPIVANVVYVVAWRTSNRSRCCLETNNTVVFSISIWLTWFVVFSCFEK